MLGPLAKPSRDLVSVHLRHAEIDERDVRAEGRRGFQRGRTIRDREHFVPGLPEQVSERIPHILMIVNHQDSPRALLRTGPGFRAARPRSGSKHRGGEAFG